jgi:hypothetical protein
LSRMMRGTSDPGYLEDGVKRIKSEIKRLLLIGRFVNPKNTVLTGVINVMFAIPSRFADASCILTAEESTVKSPEKDSDINVVLSVVTDKSVSIVNDEDASTVRGSSLKTIPLKRSLIL